MRCMSRNKVKFYYALYEGKSPHKNEKGHRTGEYDLIHGNPVEFRANISAAKGETQTRQFGEDESYDKVIVMDSNAAPIDEYSVLWVDTMPLLNADGSLKTDEKGKTITPYDYVVKKVARSLNVTAVAISKVMVSG